MFTTISNRVARYFSDEEAVVLLLILLAGFSVIVFLGQILAPVLASIVIAYLIQGGVSFFVRNGLPERYVIGFFYMLFLGSLAGVIFILLPVVMGQLSNVLTDQVPRLVAEGQQLIDYLQKNYPQYIDQEQSRRWVELLTGELGKFGQKVVSVSMNTIPDLMRILIFLVLVPMLVFFFLKDKEALLDGCARLLPKERPLLTRVWREMNDQVANYVRGKVVEILIVGTATYLAFILLEVKYPLLLGVLVGLSVIIPYIGAAIVTLPIAIIAYFQFGFTAEFWTVMIVYGGIQAIDGNLLVPVLFSEAVNLHPVWIIVAVLIFGGFWGIWGVFFAIPLATLVKAVISAWPSHSDLPLPGPSESHQAQEL